MNHSIITKARLLLPSMLAMFVAFSQPADAYQNSWKGLQGIKSISIAAYISNYPEIKHPAQTELIACMKNALGDIKIEPAKDGVPELTLFIRYCTDDKKQWVAFITDLQLTKLVDTPYGSLRGTFWRISDLTSREIDPKFNDHLLHHVDGELKKFVEDYKIANKPKP